MWFKAYAQVGLCYVKMKEHHAAIQAFRTALDDPTALQQDMLDVLYVLGRSLESIGKADQAVEVYHRINQVAPTYRDVTSRLRGLQSPRKQSNPKLKFAAKQHSWVTGLADAVQRLFVGSRK